MSTQHFDCLIIGAGITGIDAGYHLNTYCSWASYAILERRDNLGGTWDFFKYPGIRCDSDMYTFGFSWKIWKSPKPIALGEDILLYLTEAANEQGIMGKIKFNTDIRHAQWSSVDNRWYLTTDTGARFSCTMLFSCTGYYSYENPYRPTFQGEENFPGPIIHPQNWNADTDAAIVGKKVAIIGSGATAVTILPNITDVTSHVTMVQRTPTYIRANPEVDPVSQFLSNWLPECLALPLTRWKYLLLGTLFFQYCRNFPNHAKKLIKREMWNSVKDSGMELEEFETNFTPPYNPWDQRLCLTPGPHFFGAIKEGKASVATGHIECFTERGIQLKSGQHVDADVIICATGFTMQHNFPFSTIDVTIDGKPYKASEKIMYKGIMLSDVPNCACVLGYHGSSRTLKADIASLYFTKLFNYMKKNDFITCCPSVGPDFTREGGVTRGLTSGYVIRAAATLPKQGNKYPWINGMNYIVDLVNLWWYGVEDKKSLEFVPNAISNVEDDKKQM